MLVGSCRVRWNEMIYYSQEMKYFSVSEEKE